MFFNRKESKNEPKPEIKQEEILGNEAADGNDDSQKTKRLDMFIAIFSVVCALTIWLYASAVHETEIKVQSPVNLKYILDAENKGYSIQYNYETKINFTLKGRAMDLSKISEKDILVSADLSTINYSEIENEKIVQLPLIFNLPEGVVCSEKSKEYIEITITKKVKD